MGLGHKRTFILALALAGASPAAAAQPQQDAAPPPDVQKILQSCDAHKFETVVTTTEDGAVHSSNVKLCGAQGQSDEAWLHTLKDAVAKTAVNTELAPDVKQQIVAALNAEIARLTPLLPAPPERRFRGFRHPRGPRRGRMSPAAIRSCRRCRTGPRPRQRSFRRSEPREPPAP